VESELIKKIMLSVEAGLLD